VIICLVKQFNGDHVIIYEQTGHSLTRKRTLK